MTQRYCLRVYNLPIVHMVDIEPLIEIIPNLKHHWISKDNNDICMGYCWCEFHNKEDLDHASLLIADMEYLNKKLYVVI